MTTAAAPAHRAPRNTEQATALLERVAGVDGAVAAILADRDAAIAATNAAADTLALPLIQERAAIVALLEPWWTKAAAALTAGKRKSVTLGGCAIGTKKDRARLLHGDVDDDAAVARLQPLRWAKPLLKVTYRLDRAAILSALAGARGKALAELGFRKSGQGETFFVQRIDQDGAVTKAAA